MKYINMRMARFFHTYKRVQTLFSRHRFYFCLAVLLVCCGLSVGIVASRKNGGHAVSQIRNTSVPGSSSSNKPDSHLPTQANISASDGKANTNGTTRTPSPTSSKPPYSGSPIIAKVTPISYQLSFSPSSVTIPSTAVSTTFTVSTENGAKIGLPSASYNSLVVQANAINGPPTQSSWNMLVSRAWPSASGAGYVTIVAQGIGGQTYTGQVYVSYPPAPYLSCTQGTITASDDGTNTTYTTTLTLASHGNDDGAGLHYAMASGVGYIGGNFNYSGTYSGQNNIVLTAIISDYELQAIGSGFYFTDTVTITDPTARGVEGGCYVQYWASTNR